MTHDVSRREFLKATATAAAAFSVGLAATREKVFAEAAAPGGNDLIRIGIIGTGGQGRNDLGQAVRVPNLKCVAVCDIFEPNLKLGLELAGADAKPYTDYRKMLAEAPIDAVMICTPLNWHSVMTIDAMQAGKHVFCEKMMAYGVPEAKKMARVACDTGRVLQIGHQRRYNPTYIHALELLNKDKVLGRITNIRCVWHRNNDWRRPVPPDRPDLAREVRAKLRALGEPQPELSDEQLLERLINWRLYSASSQGLMAELGSHQIDVCNWFLGAAPTAVCAMGGIDYWKDGREVDDNVEVVYEYPGGVKVVFTSQTTNAYDDYYEQIMGDKGTLVLTHENKGLLYQEQRAEKLSWAEFAHTETEGGKGAIVLNAQATKKKDKTPNTASSESLAASGENPYFLEMLDWARCIRESAHPRCCCHAAESSDIACLMGNRAIHERKFLEIPAKTYKTAEFGHEKPKA